MQVGGHIALAATRLDAEAEHLSCALLQGVDGFQDAALFTTRSTPNNIGGVMLAMGFLPSGGNRYVTIPDNHLSVCPLLQPSALT